MYGLKYFAVSTYLAFITTLFPFVDSIFKLIRVYPFQEFLQKMAENLEGGVYLNANITNVEYEADRNLVTFTQNGNSEEQMANCGVTIIAFPQTANSMAGFIPSSNKGEELSELFTQVETTNNFTLLLDDSKSFFPDGPPAKYHVPEPSVPDNPAVCLLFSGSKTFLAPLSLRFT